MALGISSPYFLGAREGLIAPEKQRAGLGDRPFLFRPLAADDSRAYNRKNAIAHSTRTTKAVDRVMKRTKPFQFVWCSRSN